MLAGQFGSVRTVAFGSGNCPKPQSLHIPNGYSPYLMGWTYGLHFLSTCENPQVLFVPNKSDLNTDDITLRICHPLLCTGDWIQDTNVDQNLWKLNFLSKVMFACTLWTRFHMHQIFTKLFIIHNIMQLKCTGLLKWLSKEEWQESVQVTEDEFSLLILSVHSWLNLQAQKP